MILKRTGLQIEICYIRPGVGNGSIFMTECKIRGVGVYTVYYAMLFGWGGLFKPNQALPNQNLTICLFQVQSRFGLITFLGGWRCVGWMVGWG